jgi:hypothetical protein
MKKIRPGTGHIKPERKCERVSGMVTIGCKEVQREHIRAKETVPQSRPYRGFFL